MFVICVYVICFVFISSLFIKVRDHPEIPKVFLIISSGKKGGRRLSLLKIENLRKNLRKISERGGGVEPPENTKLEKKHVERPVRRRKLLPKDSNTIIVWLFLNRSTS